MPDLIKLYIRQVAIGFGIAAVFVAGLLYFNVMNLWYLVTHNDAGLMAVFLLWFMNGIVFAGVQFGYAIMQLGREEDETPRGPGLRDHVAIPVRVDDDKRISRFRRK
ncbi:hypothetical protein [Thalassococcus sp. S3]|uniref:hypothetical protein n=1 Tax=Thalassococcus sp. S3 TaxID=2017482 RepID=UPI001023FB64|nr:hypothetical protein [Thalassococcus sp. S3]QBF32453.1 hypothetical protein CFI11_14695 [Thalassococcus sp. S3]